MRSAVLLFVVAACGRFGFDPTASLDAADATADATPDVEIDATLPPRPDLVQSPRAQTTSAASGQINILPTRAGSLLVVATVNFNVGGVVEPISSITDDRGNLYVSANIRSTWNGTEGATEIWYAPDVSAGASVMTITYAGVTSGSTWVLELANMTPTVPLDDTGVIYDQVTNGMPIAAAVTPSRTSAVIVSVILIDGMVSQLTAGNPFTSLGLINGDAAAFLIADQLGTYGPVWDAPGSARFGASTAAFLGLAAD